MIGPLRAGFTLVEVVVALVVGGMAVTAAALLLNGLENRAETIERAAATSDAARNAERLLVQLVGNAELGDDSTPTFAGDSLALSFHSWCETTHGWLDRCAALLRFAPEGERKVLQLQLRGADTLEVAVRHSVANGRIRYLMNAESRGTWIDKWTHLGPPEAVAVILDEDTLLLRIRAGYW